MVRIHAHLHKVWNQVEEGISHLDYDTSEGGIEFGSQCSKRHKDNGNPAVTPEACGGVGERAQVIPLWIRAPDIENIFHQ